MPFVEPSTTVALYRDIPTSSGVGIFWDNKQQQTDFYAKHLITAQAACTYQRKRAGRTLIEWPISQVSQANYFSFTNPAFENIVFYCRILDKDYVNNVTTEILWEIDVWETYWHKLSYNNCMVVREQPSAAVWNRAINGTPVIDCRTDYYMTSPETLSVDKSMEKLYTGSFKGESTGDVGYYPAITDTDNDADMCILLKVALPAEIDANYTLDSDPDAGSQILFSALSGCDGFSGIYKTSTENVPTTCVMMYFNFRQNEVARFTEDGVTRLRAVLNKLTVGDMSSSIIGFYAVPRYWVAFWCNNYAESITSDGTGLVVKQRTGNIKEAIPFKFPKHETGYHPKLDMFPFKYLRVTAPDGASKEFNYEKFVPSSDTPDEFGLYITPSIVGSPSISCCPVNYGSNVADTFFTYQERIDFTGVPDCPYTIDNYLAFLSSQYTRSLSGYTVAGHAASAFGTAGQLFGLPATMPSTSTSTSNTYNQQGNPTGTKTNVVYNPGNPMAAMAGATNFVGSFLSSSEPIVTAMEGGQTRSDLDRANHSRFSLARQGIVGDEYHPGNGSFLAYLLDSGVIGNNKLYNFRFRVTKVELREDIKKAYSDYLFTYGCTANRFGVPYVCASIMGDTTPENTPTFVTHNGQTFTYVQTSGISVYGEEFDVCEKVAAMFNSGIRFLKGSEL